MNVYLEELRTHLRTTLTWAISLAVGLFVFLMLYPAFSQDASLMINLVKGFPAEVQKLLGMDMMIIGSVVGFYGFLFLYLNLCGAVQAMVLGVSLISRERRLKTADFLYAKPMTRLAIHGNKLLAALTLIVFTNVVFIAVAVCMGMSVQGGEPLNMASYMQVTLCLLWTQLFFLALGFLVAVAFVRIKSPFSVSMGTVFALYIVSMVSTLLQDEKLRYLTPFRYFDATHVVMHGGYDAGPFALGLALIALMAVGGLIWADRRDIHAAA